jgi:Flp pilus assembly protein TadD
MLFEAERALQGGYRAWLHGELRKAISLLEASRAAAPGSADALFPLARALSEAGEQDRALSVIGEAVAREPSNPASFLFRAIILLDHGDAAGARADLDRVPASNPLALALRGLAAACERGAGSAAAPTAIAPAARWIADAAGRLLALLEVDFHAERRDEALGLHHNLFSPGPAEGPRASGAPRPGAFARAKDWRAEVDGAFRSRDFEHVERLHADATVPEAWHDAATRVHRAFALIALGREGIALRSIAAHLQAWPRSADLHFLAGLAHSMAGRRREAGWAFARAARLADVEVESVLRDVASRITGRFAWLEPA